MVRPRRSVNQTGFKAWILLLEQAQAQAQEAYKHFQTQAQAQELGRKKKRYFYLLSFSHAPRSCLGLRAASRASHRSEMLNNPCYAS